MPAQIEALTEAVEQLSEDSRGIRRDLTRLKRNAGIRVWVDVAGLVAALGIAALLSWSLTEARTSQLQEQVAIAKAQDDIANQRWCPLVFAIIPGPKDPQPTTDRGRQVVEGFKRLAVEFHCPAK